MSPQYSCVERLALRIGGLLLLTGTPEQLGTNGHFARLRLLDPDRFHDRQAFEAGEAGYQAVSTLVDALLAENTEIGAPLLSQLQSYLGQEAIEELGSAIGTDALGHHIKVVIQQLLDRHGTGRVLFRNTRDAVGGFARRVLTTHLLPSPTDSESSPAGRALDDLLHPEVMLTEPWVREDPRVAWPEEWLKSIRPEKALVICARDATAQELEAHLRLRAGVRSAVFHRDMSLVARDRAAAYFSDDEDGAQVLVCSEIGSEGRNFQFCAHLVLLDLPMNPDLLEQRIGRLDRIGQKHPVQIHVPFYAPSGPAVLTRWYQDGLDAFDKVCPAGEKVLVAFRDELTQCVVAPCHELNLENLIQKTQKYRDQILAELERGRDRLLELNSFHPARGDEVVLEIRESTRALELARYMETLFDEFGVEQQPQSTNTIALHPGDHMVCESFPSLPDDGTTVTFDRSQALAREDVQFLSWEHPMVTGAMDMLLGAEFGNTSLCALPLPSEKPGTLLLEAIFIIHCPAPRRLRVQRHLALSMVRMVTDGHRALEEILSEEYLQAHAEPVPLGTSQELVRHARPQIAALVEAVEQRAAARLAEIIESAAERERAVDGEELRRLRALAKTNPNIRDEEIQHFETNRLALQAHLSRTQLKLDALRVAITT